MKTVTKKQSFTLFFRQYIFWNIFLWSRHSFFNENAILVFVKLAIFHSIYIRTSLGKTVGKITRWKIWCLIYAFWLFAHIGHIQQNFSTCTWSCTAILWKLLNPGYLRTKSFISGDLRILYNVMPWNIYFPGWRFPAFYRLNQKNFSFHQPWWKPLVNTSLIFPNLEKMSAVLIFYLTHCT